MEDKQRAEKQKEDSTEYEQYLDSLIAKCERESVSLGVLFSSPDQVAELLICMLHCAKYDARGCLVDDAEQWDDCYFAAKDMAISIASQSEPSAH